MSDDLDTTVRQAVRRNAHALEALRGATYNGSAASARMPAKGRPAGSAPAVAAPAAPRPAAPVPAAAPAPAFAGVSVPVNSLLLGVHESNAAVPVWLDVVKLLDGRVLIQGASGAGKSWTLRRLLEQAAGLIQRIVIDPEGEFRSLADATDMLHVAAHRLDGAALGELGLRVRQHRVSVVLDMSEMDREEQMRAISAFFLALIECPREHWTPAVVAIDEAHLFAPFGGQGMVSTPVRQAAVRAVVDLMSRGRKRGLAGLLATQRLARLSKSVVSEVHNFLIGLNTLDLDIRRAAETIGWDARKAFDRLPGLPPGHFIASGPAFSLSAIGVIVGSVRSRHIGAAPQLVEPPAHGSGQAAALLDLDTLAAASEAGPAFEERGRPGIRAVRGFIRDAAAPLATAIYAELVKLHPNGSAIDGMVKHFKRPRPEIVAAVNLLELFDAVEQLEGSELVRVTHDMKVSS